MMKENILDIDIIENCVELAHELDCNIIRGFTFWRKGKLDDRVDDILKKFKEPLKIIEEGDVILAIENEPSTFVINEEELDKFLRKMNYEKVKVLWDPGNDILDPYGGKAYPDGYEQVMDKVVHVHVKDGVQRESGEHKFVVFGEGDINYHDPLKALREDGYSGYLSLETYWSVKGSKVMGEGIALTSLMETSLSSEKNLQGSV
jgi:sugar phosphate isomerase/epimerase